MAVSSFEEPMPPVPVQLKWSITEASRIDVIVHRVVNTHYRDCPLRLGVAGGCRDDLCRYFTWHMNHYNTHRPGLQAYCPHCGLYEAWIEKHSADFCRRSCGLSLCDEKKKQSVKDKCHTCVEGFDEYLKSPRSSLTNSLSSNPPASVGETTSHGVGNDDENEGYYSAVTSSSSAESSPSCTQVLDELPSRDVEMPGTSFERRAGSSGFHYYRVPSESDAPPGNFAAAAAPFKKMQSQERGGSITSAHHGIPGGGGCHDDAATELYYYDRSRNGSSFDENSLPLLPPHLRNSSISSGGGSRVGTGGVNSPRAGLRLGSEGNGSCVVSRQRGGEKRNSDSAISSTSETEEMYSSIESDDMNSTTPAATLESNSTTSTVHAPSVDNSGSGSHVDTSPMEYSPSNIKELCKLTDQLQEFYREDITMLHNKGRPLYITDPQPPEAVDALSGAHIDHDWRESYAMTSSSHGLTGFSDQFTTGSARFSDSPEAIVDHRASVRKFLQGQFYLKQTYMEQVHWRRVRQIGHGGQARCFCIQDNSNNYALCLKEETENKKTLDEAFICLKLARLVDDTPPHIVEFFGASIIPHYNGNRLQLFLELMPGCLQGYVFENGPLSTECTLNYAYQLYEALDYLHQELKVIHCDIKPANLLIDYNCQRLKVADFGCAELLDETYYGEVYPQNKDAGTLWYNPPEYYCTQDCTFSMDMWQAGCSVLFMATGRRPWRHLCMDVNKQNAPPTLAKLMKKRYCDMIGKEATRSYPLPGFLTSSSRSGLRQLLFGCLDPQPGRRLSAKDCVYLAAVSETTSPDQRSRIVNRLGYAPSQDVLERLQRSGSTQSGWSLVDVYLGKEVFNTDIQGIPHTMLNGWLGSVPYQNGMTYGDLLQLVRQRIPVTNQFGECGLCVTENDPRSIWKSVSTTARPCIVKPHQPVNPKLALLLHPRCIQRTCV